MIDKLEMIPEDEYNDRFPNIGEFMDKINEIIDVVNKLEKAYNKEHCIQLDGSMKKEESDTPLTDAFIKIFDSFKEKESK